MTKLVKITKEKLPMVAELEKETFDEPWSEQALALLLTDEALAYCVEDDGVVVAYGSLLWAPDEGQILNLAVKPHARRQGHASAILAALEHEATLRHCHALFLEVRASNLPAQALYRSRGFVAVGRRTHFYKNPAEDAVVMKKDLLLCD